MAQLHLQGNQAIIGFMNVRFVVRGSLLALIAVLVALAAVLLFTERGRRAAFATAGGTGCADHYGAARPTAEFAGRLDRVDAVRWRSVSSGRARFFVSAAQRAGGRRDDGAQPVV